MLETKNGINVVKTKRNLQGIHGIWRFQAHKLLVTVWKLADGKSHRPLTLQKEGDSGYSVDSNSQKSDEEEETSDREALLENNQVPEEDNMYSCPTNSKVVFFNKNCLDPVQSTGFPKIYGILPLKPANLDNLIEETHFSRDELRLLYRRFKNFCTDGILSVEQLNEFYRKIFPKGESEQYSSFIHQAYDFNNDGIVNFEDLAKTYSTLTRGNDEERAEWIFNFYDTNKEDKVGRIQLLTVMKSIYSLLGSKVKPPVNAPAIFSHMSDVFEKITQNKTQFITRQQFVEYMLNPDNQQTPSVDYNFNETRPRRASSLTSLSTSDSLYHSSLNTSTVSSEAFQTPFSSQNALNCYNVPTLIVTSDSTGTLISYCEGEDTFRQ